MHCKFQSIRRQEIQRLSFHPNCNNTNHNNSQNYLTICKHILIKVKGSRPLCAHLVTPIILMCAAVNTHS